MQAIGTILDRALPAAMEGPRTAQSLRVTTSLDWTEALANRNTMTIPQAREIAAAPLPQPEPCSEHHFIQCIRLLLASLPKRNSDEVSGKLLIRAYQRKLGSFCKDQISFLSDKALERCEWFPTIAQCLSIISEWKRNDAPLQLQDAAKSMVFWDRQRRFEAVMSELAAGRYSQAQIDALPDGWLAVGETRGYLWAKDDGTYTARILPDGERVRYPGAVDEDPAPMPAPAGPSCRKCHDLGRILDLEGEVVDCLDCATVAEAAE